MVSWQFNNGSTENSENNTRAQQIMSDSISEIHLFHRKMVNDFFVQIQQHRAQHSHTMKANTGLDCFFVLLGG